MFRFSRKKTTDDHARALFDQSRSFLNETIMLCGAHDLDKDLNRPILSSLPIAALNEMFANGDLNRSEWPTIKQSLEFYLAHSMLTTPNALSLEQQKKPKEFGESFLKICARSCDKQLMLGQQLFKNRSQTGQAEAEAVFQQFIFTWLKEELLPNVDDRRLVPLVDPMLQSYLKFHQKVVQYIKKNFAAAS
jgi:hypothetical protein